MASSSSFSSSINMIPQNKYDVFLSFRGEDTRDNFTSHLYAALCRKQIETFIDNQLNKGDEISLSLLNAIERSLISVIIFSEGYASSGWCLDELVKILECKNKNGQIVIPIFYRVVPSDVRNQTGNFRYSFSKLEERFQGRLEKLQKWKSALREAANISGFDSHVIRSESVLIQKIVEDILKRLKDMFPNNFNKDLVGVESCIKEIESLLGYGPKVINKLGIWGIGGVGKTTIAGAIFNKISNHFDGSYFIQNIREKSEKIGDLTQVRQNLLSILLGDVNFNIGIPSFGFGFENKRLSRKKVLIVFDDVTHFKQIKSLVGSLDWFISGSLIIITTRNKQVLHSCGVNKIHEMKGLAHVHALKLLSRHAFKQNYPIAGYNELSSTIIQYCQGVPLALEVLGNNLYGKGKEYWESLIKKLKKIPNIDIQKVLKVSYDSLDDEEKNIFLDVACFLKGEDKDFVLKFLDANGFSGEIGLTNLVDVGLIVVSNNMITMHDLLQEMGMEIVRQESIDDPGKRSRLWHPKDIYEVLTYNIGTEAIQGISLDLSKVEKISLNFRTFKKMHNLRFLKFYGKNKCKIKICHFGVSSSLFPKLRYLLWKEYPFKLLPSNIHTENLVYIELIDSKVEKLWDGVQNLANVKEIDLSYSKKLTKLPNFSKAQNLEKLSLEGCSGLVETHSSVQYLNKLVILDLEECKSLKSLPSSICSKSLKFLYLSECSNLKRFPEISSCYLEELYLNGTGIKELPSSIKHQSRLVKLDLQNCSRLESIPNNLCKLKALEYLNLSGCSKLQRLPDELGNLEALKRLFVDGTALREVPSSIVRLSNLFDLSFERFRGRDQMGFIMPISLGFNGMDSLTFLELIDCGITELPESLGQLSSLKDLYLQKNNFKRIPESIINLSQLRRLYLSHCKRLQLLPKLPCSLHKMDANHCMSLETLSGLSILFEPPKKYEGYTLTNCYKLDGEELSIIVKEALQKIQHIKRHLEYYGNFGAHIIFPGGEILDWFSYQSMGSGITLKMPAYDVFNNKIAGFAFCVVVAFEEHHYCDHYFSLFLELKVKSEDGDWHLAYGGDWHLAYDDDFGRSFGFVDSDHVFVGYQVQDRLFRCRCDTSVDSSEIFIQFYLKDYRDKQIDCCEVVKKCGIHLLCA